MKRNPVQEIIDQVVAGMTGDQKHDWEYLNQKLEEYEEHPLGSEISKEIGRLLYSVMPEEERERFRKTMEQEGVELHLAIQNAVHHVRNKQLLQARAVLAKEIKHQEKLYPYKNTEKIEYYCFDEPFERALHSHVSQGHKECHNLSVPFPLAYYIYATIMMDMNQMEAARRALDKGLRWNPYSVSLILKRAEVISKSMDEIALLEGTKTALLYAYKPEQVSACYANFARYYLQQKQYKLGIGCCMIAQHFSENNEDALEILKQLYEETDGEVMPPNMEEVKELAKEADLPFGTNRDVIGLAFAYGYQYYKEKIYEPALYFLQIGYHLTDDEDAETAIEEIKQHLEENK